MTKQIDPMDIKNAIKNGQLEVILKKVYRWETCYYLYIRDTETGDIVWIKSLSAREVK